MGMYLAQCKSIGKGRKLDCILSYCVDLIIKLRVLKDIISYGTGWHHSHEEVDLINLI